MFPAQILIGRGQAGIGLSVLVYFYRKFGCFAKSLIVSLFKAKDGRSQASNLQQELGFVNGASISE